MPTVDIVIEPGGSSPDGREQLGRLARALNRRLLADYDAVDTLTIDDARHARDDAVSFVAFCERLIDET
jgi:hypothetical protein